MSEDGQDGQDGQDGGIEPTSDWLTISNEFTAARVRTVRTRNGHRLEIESQKMGTRVLVDPLELESLTWQTPETFSRLLEHPYGPEDLDPRPLSRLLGDRGAAGSVEPALGPGPDDEGDPDHRSREG